MNEEDRIFPIHLKLKDTYGIDRLDTEIHPVTVFYGANESGKSSALMAASDFFSGGFTPEAVRREDLDGDGICESPCEKAEAWIDFNDNSKMYRWSTLKESHLDVFSADGAKLRAPKTYVDEMCSPGSWNPMEFLKASAKDRAAFLLKTMPLNFTADELNQCFAVLMDKLPLPPLPLIVGPVPLQRYNELYEGKYSERTDLNHQRRNLQGMVEEQEKYLPAADEKDWAAESRAIQARLTGVEKDISETDSKIRLKYQKVASDARDKYQHLIETEVTSIRAYLTAVRLFGSSADSFSRDSDPTVQAADRLNSLHVPVGDGLLQFTASVIRIKDLEQERVKTLAQIEKDEIDALYDQIHEKNELKTALTGELATATEKAAAQERAKGVKEALEKTRESLQGVETKIVRIETILKAMDRLKIQKLKDLPIKGLDIITKEKGGPTIMIGGLPFDRLSGEQQLYNAIMAVNQAMTGRLRILFAECAELDEDHLITLGETCEKAKIALIATMRRAGEKLRVLSLQQFKELVASERKAIQGATVQTA